MERSLRKGYFLFSIKAMAIAAFVWAVFALAACIVFAIDLMEFKSISIQATATIERLIDIRNDGTSYKPVFSFTARDGHRYEVASGFSSNPPIGKAGETVHIRYIETDPSKARIDAPMTAYTFPLMFGITGLCALAIGIVLLKRRPENASKAE